MEHVLKSRFFLLSPKKNGTTEFLPVRNIGQQSLPWRGAVFQKNWRPDIYSYESLETLAN